jgi:hypothetical protein
LYDQSVLVFALCVKLVIVETLKSGNQFNLGARRMASGELAEYKRMI